MTNEYKIKKDLIYQNLQEIDMLLNDVSLTEYDRQILLEKCAEYEEQLEELDEDYPFEIPQNLLENEIHNSSDSELYSGSASSNEDSGIEYSHNSESDVEYESIYFKYCFEHCNKIQDVIDTLDSLKSYFEQLQNEGHELTEPVDGGYCFIDKIYQENQNENN